MVLIKTTTVPTDVVATRVTVIDRGDEVEDLVNTSITTTTTRILKTSPMNQLDLRPKEEGQPYMVLLGSNESKNSDGIVEQLEVKAEEENEETDEKKESQSDCTRLDSESKPRLSEPSVKKEYN